MNKRQRFETRHTPGPWQRKAIPGHVFELTDADGNPVLRIRGGMMPSFHDALLLEAAPELKHWICEVLERCMLDDHAPDVARELEAEARALLARIDGKGEE